MANPTFMRRAIMAAVALTHAGPLSALERIALDPIDHAAASLTIDGTNGSRTLTPAELEDLGAVRHGQSQILVFPGNRPIPH